MRPRHPDPPARRKLVASATRLMLARGYAGTSVDEVCAAASVTKGSFFHYFRTKEDLGSAVLDLYLARVLDAMEALRSAEPDPLRRVTVSLEFLADAAEHGPLRDGCILGGFAQDLSATHPAIRSRCAHHFDDWIARIERDIAEAAAGRRGPPVDARSLAEHIVASFEGAIILAKASGDPAVVRRALHHAREHMAHSIGRAPRRKTPR